MMGGPSEHIRGHHETQRSRRPSLNGRARYTSKPRMWQQGELTAAMTRMQRDGRDPTLSTPSGGRVVSRQVGALVMSVMRRQEHTGERKLAVGWSSDGDRQPLGQNRLKARHG